MYNTASLETLQNAVEPYGKIVGFVRSPFSMVVVRFNEPIKIYYEKNKKVKSTCFSPHSGFVGPFGFFQKADWYPFHISIWGGSNKKYFISRDNKTFIFYIRYLSERDCEKIGFNLLSYVDQQKEMTKFLSIFFERLVENEIYLSKHDDRYVLQIITEESVNNELIRIAEWWDENLLMKYSE